MMLTSLDVMRIADISRATLNNYISLGLLPRPEVRNPGGDAATQARQIGYFPESVIERIQEVRELKKSGMSMTDIAKQLAVGDAGDRRAESMGEAPGEGRGAPRASVNDPAASGALRVTIENIPFPAYMVNYNFEVTWYNEQARQELLGNFERMPGDIKERNALVYLLNGQYGQIAENRESLVQFHLRLGKGRISRHDMLGVLTHQGAPGGAAGARQTIQADAMPSGSLVRLPLSLNTPAGDRIDYSVHASYYREGILFVYAPGGQEDTLLGLLERRDEVIRTLLKRRLPVLTDVAVLVADLQDSCKICTELPADEYFELINQIWATMDPIFRRFYGTHGKHVGDGMVYYFFPQPDCDYILNTLLCAQEIKAAMRKISKEWQLRKNWLNELYLNTGINEGHEWLGVFHVDTKVEFTVLGDTINHTARLSDFARCGAVWATKNLLGKLSTEQRSRVKFGIRRRNAENHEVLVTASYSRMTELTDLKDPGNEKLRDIAMLPVTEIIYVSDDLPDMELNY